MAKSPIKTSRASLKSRIFDNLKDAVILVDDKQEIVDFNLAAKAILPKKVKNKNVAFAFRNPVILKAINRVLEGKPQKPREIEFSFPVGKVFELNVTALKEVDKKQRTWALVVFTDITLHKRAESMRADFVANVSHELRSPLTSLIGMIETLQQPAKNDPEAQEKFLSVMSKEANRMSGLIQDLLSLSKLEANEHVRPSDNLNIPALIEALEQSFEIKSKELNMPLEVSLAKNLPPVIGDLEEIRQVLINLIENAFKYGEKGTQISISVQTVDRIPDIDEPGVQIAITNQGEGISPEHLPRLTERFYRVDKARSRSIGGTGLGLAIVKHIVNRHRGQMSIKSVQGSSTTFSIQLPTT